MDRAHNTSVPLVPVANPQQNKKPGEHHTHNEEVEQGLIEGTGVHRVDGAKGVVG